MTTSVSSTTVSLSTRAREILAAVERTVADRPARSARSHGSASLGAEHPVAVTANRGPAYKADRAGPYMPDAPRRTPAGDEADPLVALVLGVADHTQQARATLDELGHALERLARHLAFDR